MKKKYRRYSPEFKRHTLKRASEDGVTDKEVCEELGISARQLRRWRDADANDLGRAATTVDERSYSAHESLKKCPETVLSTGTGVVRPH